MRLDDKRLLSVTDKITDRICQKQQLCLRKLGLNGNEEIQFGRFISNQRVRVDSLQEVLTDRFRAACPTGGHILLLQDTSQMAFSLNRKVAGLGKVDEGQVQGFYLHPVLCLDADSGACHGVAALTFLHRQPTASEGLTSRQTKALRSRAAFEDEESYRWYSSIKGALGKCPCPVRKTVVADREADIYPLLAGLVDWGGLCDTLSPQPSAAALREAL